MSDSTEQLSSVGGRIAAARMREGLTQSDLARLLKLSRGAVGLWESGRAQPSAGNLRRVAKLLKVPTEWLDTGRGATVLAPNHQDNAVMPEGERIEISELGDKLAQPIKAAIGDRRAEVWQLTGDKLLAAGYHPGDYLIVDLQVPARPRDFVLAEVAGTPIFRLYLPPIPFCGRGGPSGTPYCRRPNSRYTARCSGKPFLFVLKISTSRLLNRTPAGTPGMGSMLKVVASDVATKELPVDACVIDDKPDHVVLAVKIPKSTIRDNMALLAYLADAQLPQAVPSPKPTQPRFSARRAALVAATGALALVGAGLAGTLTATPKPPVVWLDFRIDNPVLKPGGELVFTVVGIRNRLCKADIDRNIVERDTDASVWRARIEGMSQALSKEPVTRQVKVPLPAGLKDGHYIYRSATYSDCGNGDVYSLPSPDLAFEIRS